APRRKKGCANRRRYGILKERQTAPPFGGRTGGFDYERFRVPAGRADPGYRCVRGRGGGQRPQRCGHEQGPPVQTVQTGRRREMMDVAAIMAKVDHTLLKPEATWADIKKICDEAMEY